MQPAQNKMEVVDPHKSIRAFIVNPPIHWIAILNRPGRLFRARHRSDPAIPVFGAILEFRDETRSRFYYQIARQMHRMPSVSADRLHNLQ